MDFCKQINEDRIRGKPKRGRRIQMPHDLANNDGYVALKWAAKDRERWRFRKGCQKPALQQKTTDDDNDMVTILVI